MKTRRMYATTAFVGMMVLAGCTQQEEPGANAPSMEGMPIRVTTQVMNPETRQEMETKDLTEFYFRVTDAGGTTTHYDYFAKMTKQGDGSWTTEDGDAEWKAATAQVSAVAQKTDGGWTTWEKTDYDNGKEVSVLANQSAAESAGVKASDLLHMHATEIDPTNTAGNPAIVNGKVKVTMNHAFAKLEVTVKVQQPATETGNPITDLTVEGTKLKAMFTPAAATPLDVESVSGDNNATAITPFCNAYNVNPNNLLQNATATYECIIVPQTVEECGFTVKATVDGKKHTYIHNNRIDFTANKKYTLTLTIPAEGSAIEIDGNVSVGGWDDTPEDLGDETVGELSLDLEKYKDNLNSDDLKNTLINAFKKGQTNWVLTGGVKLTYDRIEQTGNAVRAALKAIDGNNQNTPRRITISMPDATEIGEGAFNGCYALASITLPKATTIGEQAFINCKSLTSINFPAVMTIGKQAFDGCINLQTVTLPDAVTSINDGTFDGCTSLTTIKLSKVTAIGEMAFFNCQALTSVDLSAATTIGGSAFCGCTNLKTAGLSAATTIGKMAFCECKALTSVDLSAATDIGEMAFFKCTNLKTVSQPSADPPAEMTVGKNAFRDCNALRELSFGSLITSWSGDVLIGVENTGEIALTLHPEQLLLTNNNNQAVVHNLVESQQKYFDSDAAKSNLFCGYTFKSITEYTAPTE